MYVDDIIGVSFEEDVAADMAGVKALCEQLLGAGSISDKKSEVDTDGELDVIGYTVNVRTGMVGIAQRNVRKAFYATTEFDPAGAVTLRQMQRVASHASRYRKICPYMAPFANALHQAQRGHPHGNQHPFTLSAEAQRSVWILRALILLTATGLRKYARSFQSITRAAWGHTWVVEYDASLTGLGIIWFEVMYDAQGGAREEARGCATIDISQFGFDESGKMNTAEFVAATMGMRGLVRQGIHDTGIMLRGDNMSAMTWAHKQSFRSATAFNAACVHVAQGVRHGLDVVAWTHLPHTSTYDYNWRCDYASRGTSWATILSLDKREARPRLPHTLPQWDLDETHILPLCDPNLPTGTQNAFEAFWRTVLTTI
jgi:hypothetical protein